MERRIIVATSDDVVADKIRAAVESDGASAQRFQAIEAAKDQIEPSAIVVDLGLEGAVDAAAMLRARWRETLIAGFVSLPDPALWQAALDAGYNLVATRGTIATRLREALEAWTGPPTAQRFRLFDTADVVGRLGVVARMPETPVGPIAVYQVSRKLFAASDSCPHAGAKLSEGEIEGTVVTCPRHGSRFDLSTGERVRGPADEPIATFRVVVEQGVAYLEH